MGLLDFETPEGTMVEKTPDNRRGRPSGVLLAIGGAVFIAFLVFLGAGYYAKIKPQPEERISKETAASSCFILREENCGSLGFIYRQTNGERANGVGAFIPEGTTIYAPFSGTINTASSFKDGDEEKIIVSLVRAEDAEDSSERLVARFYANGWGERKIFGEQIKKGEIIGTIIGEEILLRNSFKDIEANFMMSVDFDWHNQYGVEAGSANDYLKSFVEFVEQKPLN